MLRFVRVHGSSMSPSLCDGDFVLVLSARLWPGKPLGRVVWAAHPRLGPLLKRVVDWDVQRGVTLRGENALSSSSADLGRLSLAAIRGIAWLRIARDGSLQRLPAR